MGTQEVLVGYCKADEAVVSAFVEDYREQIGEVTLLAAEESTKNHPFWNIISRQSSPVLIFLSNNFFYTPEAMYMAEQSMPVLIELGKVFPIAINPEKEDLDNKPDFTRWSTQVKIKTFWERARSGVMEEDFIDGSYLEEEHIERISKGTTNLLEFLSEQSIPLLKQILKAGGVPVLKYIGATAQPVPMPHTYDHLYPDSTEEESAEDVIPPLEDIPGLEMLPNISSKKKREGKDRPSTETRDFQPLKPDKIKNKKESHLLDKLVQHRNEKSEQEHQDISPSRKTQKPVPFDQLNKEIARRIDEEKTEGKKSKQRYASNKKILDTVFELKDKKAFDQAIEILENALKRNTDDIDLRYELGVLQLESKQYFEAAATFYTLLQDLPLNAPLRLHLAHALEQTGRDQEAIKYYRAAVQLDPEHSRANFKLASLLKKQTNANSAEIRTYFKQACKQDKLNPFYRYQYGRYLYRELRKLKKARKQLEKAIELAPEYEEAWFELANIHRDMGDIPAANTCLKRAATLRVSHSDKDRPHPFEDEEYEEEESREELTGKESSYTPADQRKSPDPGNNSDKTVLITGATSGIGRATAEKFAEAGYQLILCGRRANRLDTLQKIWSKKYTTKILTLCFDIRERNEVLEAWEKLPEDWQKVDILVNNAGLASGLDPIHEGNPDDWETMIDTNIKGLLYITRLVSPGMVSRNQGHIINLCSTAGKETYPRGNVYCATKHAVDALTKAMRIDLHTHNIRVSQVSPAHVEETEFAKVRFHGDREKAKIYEDFNPLTSADVAEAIYFIASRPAHVNVQDILLMGTQQANSNFIHRSGRIYDEEE